MKRTLFILSLILLGAYIPHVRAEEDGHDHSGESDLAGEYEPHLDEMSYHGDFNETDCQMTGQTQGYYYGVAHVEIHHHEEDGDEEEHYELEQMPDVCPNTTEWVKLPNDELRATCGTWQLSASLLSGELFVTVLQDHSYCSFVFDAEAHSDGDDHHELSSSTRWGHGLLAVLLVTAFALAGLLILVRQGLELLDKYLMELLSLAAGSLVGSAVFVILPEAIEILGYDFDFEVCLLVGMFVGLLMETVFHTHTFGTGASTHLHQHNWDTNKDKKPAQEGASGNDIALAGIDVETGPEASHLVEKDTDSKENTKEMDNIDEDDERAKAAAFNHMVLISVAGDALHNFIDGALIGAVFATATSLSTPWTTTIAICLHEFPQELGDFGILLKGGLSTKKALLLNLLVGATAILGAIITLSLGEALDDSVNFMLPISAGLFIYLAFTDLVPEIMKVANDRNRAIRLLIIFILALILMKLTTLIGEHTHGDGDGHDGHNH